MEQVCIDRRCQPVDLLGAQECRSKCHGHGVSRCGGDAEGRGSPLKEKGTLEADVPWFQSLLLPRHVINLSEVFPHSSGHNNGTHILEGMKWVWKLPTSDQHARYELAVVSPGMNEELLSPGLSTL